MRISLHYNELSSINASDKWALADEPYLRSHLHKSLRLQGVVSEKHSKKLRVSMKLSINAS